MSKLRIEDLIEVIQLLQSQSKSGNFKLLGLDTNGAANQSLKTALFDNLIADALNTNDFDNITSNTFTISEVEVDPETIDNPEEGKVIMGFYDGEYWSKDSNGTIREYTYGIASDPSAKSIIKAESLKREFEITTLDEVDGEVYPNDSSYYLAGLIDKGLYSDIAYCLLGDGTSNDGTKGYLHSIKPLINKAESTRSTTITRINKDGYLETVPALTPCINNQDFEAKIYSGESYTQLIQYSNEFDNAYWTKTGATIDDNSGNGYSSPHKDYTAFKLIEDNSNSSHEIYVGIGSAVQNQVYTFTCYAKSSDYSTINISNSNSTVWNGNVIFDLENESFIEYYSSIASITKLSNGWYKCSVTNTILTDGAIYPTIGLINNEACIYQGDGTSGVYIFGAQLTQTPSAKPYTYSSGSTVTVGADDITISDLLVDEIIDTVCTVDYVTDNHRYTYKYLDDGTAQFYYDSKYSSLLTKTVANDFTIPTGLTEYVTIFNGTISDDDLGLTTGDLFTLYLISDQSTISQNTFIFQAPVGESITVDWGDGNSETIEGLGATDIIFNSNYTVEGTYNVIISGNVLELTNIKIYNQLNISGNVNDWYLLINLTRMICYSTSLSGDVSNLSSLNKLDYLTFSSTSVTFDNQTTFSNTGTIYLRDCNWTSTMVDNCLISLAASPVQNATINIAGNNAARTSASDAAVAILEDVANNNTLTVNE